jgi:heme oxygenase
VLYLRNLLPAYSALERGLERHRDTSGLRELADYRLDRATAIESDLMTLRGQYETSVPLLPAAEAYARRIAEIAEGDGYALIAHAYARYLGDLSGGQILRRLLGKSPGLRNEELSFYDFPRFPDLGALKNDYREALDRAASQAPDAQAIIDEGSRAFSLNIDLSWAVQKALPATLNAAAE